MNIKKIAFFGLTLLLLSSCAKNEKIISEDKSAEYKSATSLPPLKKTTNSKSPAQASVSGADTSAAIPVSAVVPAPITIPAVKQADSTQMTPTLVDNADESALIYSQPFEQTWTYLADTLSAMGLTINHRNKSAGEFSVACADLGESDIGEIQEVKTSSKWSLFRKVEEVKDSCFIRLQEVDSKTKVYAQNRFGQTINNSVVKQLYSDLIN